jgi:hypothetical protein
MRTQFLQKTPENPRNCHVPLNSSFQDLLLFSYVFAHKFLKKYFFKPNSTHLKSLKNSALFDTHIGIFQKNFLGVIWAIFEQSELTFFAFC